MAKKETKEISSEGSDIRYKYIGFDVYGSKVKKFFKSEEEKKQYEEKVAEYNKTHFSPLRSGTTVKANLMGGVDKLILTLTSLGLIVGGLLPWFSVNTIYGQFRIPGATAFLSVSGLMGLMGEFSSLLPILVYIFSVLGIVSIIFGVVTLIMLYLPSKNKEASQGRLKHALGWQYLPLTIWAAVFIFLVVGIKIPFGEEISDIYAISGLGSKFNIVTFASFSQPALWLCFVSLIINAIKSNDL